MSILFDKELHDVEDVFGSFLDTRVAICYDGAYYLGSVVAYNSGTNKTHKVYGGILGHFWHGNITSVNGIDFPEEDDEHLALKMENGGVLKVYGSGTYRYYSPPDLTPGTYTHQIRFTYEEDEEEQQTHTIEEVVEAGRGVRVGNVRNGDPIWRISGMDDDAGAKNSVLVQDMLPLSFAVAFDDNDVANFNLEDIYNGSLAYQAQRRLYSMMDNGGPFLPRLPVRGAPRRDRLQQRARDAGANATRRKLLDMSSNAAYYEEAARQELTQRPWNPPRIDHAATLEAIEHLKMFPPAAVRPEITIFDDNMCGTTDFPETYEEPEDRPLEVRQNDMTWDANVGAYVVKRWHVINETNAFLSTNDWSRSNHLRLNEREGVYWAGEELFRLRKIVFRVHNMTIPLERYPGRRRSNCRPSFTQLRCSAESVKELSRLFFTDKTGVLRASVAKDVHEAQYDENGCMVTVAIKDGQVDSRHRLAHRLSEMGLFNEEEEVIIGIELVFGGVQDGKLHQNLARHFVSLPDDYENETRRFRMRYGYDVNGSTKDLFEPYPDGFEVSRLVRVEALCGPCAPSTILIGMDQSIRGTVHVGVQKDHIKSIKRTRKRNHSTCCITGAQPRHRFPLASGESDSSVQVVEGIGGVRFTSDLKHCTVPQPHDAGLVAEFGSALQGLNAQASKSTLCNKLKNFRKLNCLCQLRVSTLPRQSSQVVRKMLRHDEVGRQGCRDNNQADGRSRSVVSRTKRRRVGN